MYAIEKGDMERVRKDIASGIIDVNRRTDVWFSKHMNYPLQLLCRVSSRHEESTSSQLMELLLSAKADVNLGYYSPLDELCDQKHPNLGWIQRLVEAKAHVVNEEKRHNAFSWLFRPETQDKVRITEYLLKHTSAWDLPYFKVSARLSFSVFFFHFSLF